MKLTKTTKKKIIIISIATLLGINSATVSTSIGVYDHLFGRFELPDYNLYCGEYNFDRLSKQMNIKSFSFMSDDCKLSGHYYSNSNPKGIVIVSHGLHAGEYDYLPAIEYFYMKNYDVISYNYKGTYESEGDGTVGMVESLVDLDNLLKYISKKDEYKDKKLFLFGHSWGGFASTAVLSLHKNISAVASVAGFNDAQHLVGDKGSQYAGKVLTAVPKVILETYQKLLFKHHYKYTSVDGINSSNVPVFIAHGNEDKVIDYNLQSIISKKDVINNSNVCYYIGDSKQAGHNTILLSNEAVDYQEKIDHGLKSLIKEKGRNLTYDEKVEYYSNVDHHLYSSINTDLFDKIDEFFISTIK